MSKTLDSNPRRDGFRMPGEFEPHAGCWMLWPERPDNWRLGGKPAQQAFVALATAIAGSEPVTIGVSAAQYANARRLLPPQVRVVELSSNDAWMRDVGPTFVVNDRGSIRGVDWQFNAWGGLQGGLVFPLGPRRCGGAEGHRDRRLRPLPGALHPGRRLDPRGRAGHGDHHRGMPAQSQPQPGSQPHADRDAAQALSECRSRRLAGQGRACTTRRTATSTTSAPTCGQPRWC